jgi:hypothetical protein
MGGKPAPGIPTPIPVCPIPGWLIIPACPIPGCMAGAGGRGARIIGVDGRIDGGSELDVGLGACESAPMLL